MINNHIITNLNFNYPKLHVYYLIILILILRFIHEHYRLLLIN